MENKTIGGFILGSVGLAVVAVILDPSEAADTLYMIAGFGLFIFGTIGGLRLQKK